MNEVWKPIAGYEGLYEVSNFGRVRFLIWRGGTNPEGGIMKGNKQAHGYIHYCLTDKNKIKRTHLAHILVANAFIGKRPIGFDVNHLNGNKDDNRADNLEYVSRIENIHHAIKSGLHNTRGSRNGRAKLTDDMVIEIRMRHANGDMQSRLAREYGVSHQQISLIVNRKTWKHVK